MTTKTPNIRLQISDSSLQGDSADTVYDYDEIPFEKTQVYDSKIDGMPQELTLMWEQAIPAQ